MKITLPKPFGYIGPSMLEQNNDGSMRAFIGHNKRLYKTEEAVYTLSQIRWLLGLHGIEVEIQEGD